MNLQDFTCLNDIITYHQEHFNNKTLLNCLGSGKVVSSQEFCQEVNNIAWGLKQLPSTQQNNMVAIYCYQGWQWLVCDLAIASASLVSVPIFHNISQPNLQYQLELTQTKVIITDKPDFAQQYCQQYTIITVGFACQGCLSFSELSQLGKTKNQGYQQLPKSPSDNLATIVFTSGTTNKPKGVMLSHGNLISQIIDCSVFFPLSPQQKALSYLPLAHIFERMVMLFYLTQGVSIYFVDDIAKIPQYLKQVQPNLFTTVPRLLEKVFNKIKQQAQTGNLLSKILLKLAFNRAKNFHPSNKASLLNSLLDLLLYKKLRAIFGGQVQTIICGGASLPSEIEKFLHSIGLAVFCGYGLTESSPVLATNCPANYKLGTVGANFPSVSLQIAHDGELLAYGKNIMLGYFCQEAETKQTLNDGWLYTGDLAEINDGFVKIIGRKKELLKTSNGKYVVANHLQQMLQQQITGLLGSVIIAEGKPFVAVLLFFEPESLPQLHKQIGYVGENFWQSSKLDNWPELNNWVKQQIDIVNQQLDSWQQIKKFCIIAEPLSIEKGQITPSYKLNNRLLQQQFANKIANFYETT